MRKQFCNKVKKEPSVIRFFFNGERLNDETILNVLSLNNEEIEAFEECKGGGPPTKKRQTYNDDQILEALNESLEDCERDKVQGEENESRKEKTSRKVCVNPSQPNHSDLESEKDKITVDASNETVLGLEAKEVNSATNDSVGYIEKDNHFTMENDEADENINLSGRKEEVETIKEIEKEENENDGWLNDLRLKFKSGGVPGKSNLHKQLKFYLELPQITLTEQNIVKTLLTRINMHSNWEREKNQQYPQKEKKARKRKSVEPMQNEFRCLRSKRGDSDQELKSNDSEKKSSKSEGLKIQDDENSNTPTQRKNLFKLFGIVSPFMRQKIPTEEELRRFSLAVHLWAEKTKGSVEFLMETKLTERHFKEVLIFAGPGSRWKLIPDRSTTQYKNLWSNTAKGKHHFHGDPETGFESRLKLHEPSLSYCPFGHCQLTKELITYDSEKSNHSPRIEPITASRRQLFTPNISDPKPSPTKEELREQNNLLIQEILSLKSSAIKRKTSKTESDEMEIITFVEPKIVKCIQPGCVKSFATVFGLEQHMKKVHEEIKDYQNPLQVCPFCGKETKYIDQHIKTVHKEMKKNDICEVCKQRVKQDMKKHRSVCIFCPFCDYQNRKKDRLLRHIETNHRENSLQAEPMDLTSPRKLLTPIEKKTDENGNLDMRAEALDLTSPSKDEGKADQAVSSNKDADTEPLDLSPPAKNEMSLSKSEDVDKQQFGDNPNKKFDSKAKEALAALDKKRLNYPFDDETEPYNSELEEEDTEEFTLHRRQIKDHLEKELRQVDNLEAKEVDGDLEVLNQFETFMKQKTSRSNESHGYETQVSTVGMYTRALKNDLLPAFHQLFKPFDSRWILDCTSPKECTFDGEKRFFVKPEEPIYITPKVIQTALENSKEKGGQQGGQRGTILNSTIQFMNFIEIFFNQRLNVYGREPYKNVNLYHQAVRTFISGTGAWKMCNDEKDKAQNENVLRQSYLNPNKEIEVLQRYKTFLTSKERLKNLNKILVHSDNEESRPSDREMTELGKIVMGEIGAATGCRPVVLLKLPTGAYTDKQPGFNPYNTTKDDCVVDEEDGSDKIFRRVNPNLPPRNKACLHQLDLNVAECPVMCKDACQPDGYNLLISWDKTYGTKGPSYLHIPKELKHLMDIYDVKRIRYFRGRKSPFTNKDDWIHDDATPFFLTAACSAFKSLDLKHISESMGIDVTAYNFRKIVSTWALSHASEEIRSAEEEALQHSLKVAKENYLQNKQSKPQKLTQTYVEEENLFPKSFKEKIEKTNVKVRKAIQNTEVKRTKKRIETLVKKKEAYKLLKSEHRPLGPKHRILFTQRKRFLELLKKVENVEINSLKPLQWRQFVVRAVCTAKDEQGEELRKLWTEMYQGDLRWGIRDVRLRAQANNWPMHQVTSRRDRNSWIAASIRQSYLSKTTRGTKIENQ